MHDVRGDLEIKSWYYFDILNKFHNMSANYSEPNETHLEVKNTTRDLVIHFILTIMGAKY